LRRTATNFCGSGSGKFEVWVVVPFENGTTTEVCPEFNLLEKSGGLSFSGLEIKFA